MDVIERKRPRGAFLNLFDWPGKSRKKLFSSNISEVSEESKQGKDNVQNSSMSRHSLFEDQIGKNSTYNPRSDSSCCASSVTSDDGNGVRAPSVVARLMGLECLPLPNVVEPRFNPDLDPYFLRSARQTNTWDGYDNQSDFDGVSWDHVDSRMSKGGRKRMIERFQTETLPPRSAKPISITHNKLLSPIRNPGFVPSRNPAYVMEAASRMIESSPRMVARTRVSSSDCSSPVPLRIRDLKEKLEAAQRASTPQIYNDTRNSKYLRGDHKPTTSSSTVAASKFLAKTSSDVKPPSFSAQTKISSSHKQESLNKRTASGQKEKAEAKNRAAKTQNGLKAKNVLKQNYQKQNCRDNHQPAMTYASNQQCKKVMNKVVNKVLVESGSTSKSPSFTMTSAEKPTSLPISRKKSLLRNKKPRNGVQEQVIYDDKLIKRGEKSIKCNVTIDGDLNTSKDEKKRDTDVISFTFSSSIKGLSPHAHSFTQGNKQDVDSAVRFNVIGGDSLNALLEQKLRELTSKIESSSSNLIQEESLSSISKDGANGLISLPSKHDKLNQNSLESESVSDCTSFYGSQNSQKKMLQAEEHEVNSISVLTESEDFGLSCSKSYSDCRQDTEYGMKLSSSDQELTWVSSNESHQTLDETESAATQDWEFEYITKILNSGQLMFQDFTSGTTTDVLPPSLFDEMEHSREAGTTTTTKIERKTLFDCVNQCVAVKCERMFIGSCKGIMSGKDGILLEHRNLLAEEVNREVQGLKNTREMMIDELVDEDMSRFEGKWIDYDKEMFEEGIDIEEEIVSGLVDELVNDLCLSSRCCRFLKSF